MREIKADKPILFNTDMVKAILSGQKTQTRRIVKFENNISDKSEFYAGKCALGTGVFDEKANRVSKLPQYSVGDTLWVRESIWQAGTWTMSYPEDDEYSSWKGSNRYFYVADGTPPNEPNKDYPEGLRNGSYSAANPDKIWRKFPSIHMPRSAARLFLKVTDVRVKRLQDIDSCGAWNEGVRCKCMHPVPECAGNKVEFTKLWNSIYAVQAPVKKNGIITHYESYPWEDIQEVKKYKGLPWHVYGNPWVRVIEFEKLNLCEHGISDYCQKSSGCTYCTEDMI